MERWHEVSTEQLEQMYPTLPLIEMVCADNKPELYFYGLTTADSALEAAQEAVRGRFNEEDEAEEYSAVGKPTEIAVCLRLNSDTLYYLLRGLYMNGETFAYQSPNEGVRTERFEEGSGVYRFKLSDSDFSKLALSDSDSWIDDFLTKNGTKAEASAAPIARTEPAKAEPKLPAPSATNPIDSFLND